MNHSWPTWFAELRTRIISLANTKGDNHHHTPILVGLAGPPGSGKTTTASQLQASLVSTDTFSTVLVVSLDGFHMPLAKLREIDMLNHFTQTDVSSLEYRRGCIESFEDPSQPNGLIDRLRLLLLGQNSVSFPGFDHEIGDPEPNCVTFSPSNNSNNSNNSNSNDNNKPDLVILEGLYLLDPSPSYAPMKEFLALSIFISTPIEECIARVKKRNLCLPNFTPSEILERCERVDRVNADRALQGKHRADVLVGVGGGFVVDGDDGDGEN